jgi:hypothetical protein
MSRTTVLRIRSCDVGTLVSCDFLTRLIQQEAYSPHNAMRSLGSAIKLGFRPGMSGGSVRTAHPVASIVQRHPMAIILAK